MDSNRTRLHEDLIVGRRITCEYANVHATVRVAEVLTHIQVLSIKLEWLTKWLIGLTVVRVI